MRAGTTAIWLSGPLMECLLLATEPMECRVSFACVAITPFESSVVVVS